MVLGSPQGHRDLIARLAVGAGAIVYAPDYRLAPQHPFPASTEDTLAAYRALLEQGVRPQDLVVAGDSAGGVLTLTLLTGLREAGLPSPAAAVTISPAPDLTFPSESWQRNADTDYLTLPVVRRWMEYYAKPEQLSDPRVSPIHADLAGLPPMLVQAGEAECLYDEIALLVRKLAGVGVDVRFESYPEMPHVWHLFRSLAPEGDVAIQQIADYVCAQTGRERSAARVA
jgi:acetyl esterase/lipase